VRAAGRDCGVAFASFAGLLATMGTATARSACELACRAVEESPVERFEPLVRLEQVYQGEVIRADLDDEDGIVGYESNIVAVRGAYQELSTTLGLADR